MIQIATAPFNFAYRAYVRPDGIEVFTTSEKTLSLTWTERQKQFMALMENEYSGRTAKFIRNGHAYYARFDKADVRKNIYGDKKSDKNGYRAKINEGADGGIFDLVENAAYSGSGAETGKHIKAHGGVYGWDYFVKTVQINNRVFDLLANVRKKENGEYVYSLQLTENKKIEATPPTTTHENAAVLKSGGTTSTDSISSSGKNVNSKFSRGSQGNNLTAGQQEYFRDSKVRDDNGNLLAAEKAYNEATPIQAKLNRLVDGICDEIGVDKTENTQKSVKSIVSRMKRNAEKGKGSSPYALKDLARSHFELDSFDQIPDVLDALSKKISPTPQTRKTRLLDIRDCIFCGMITA